MDTAAHRLASPRRPRLIPPRLFNQLHRALRTPDDELSATESASTLFRFVRSKHVSDFRLIVAAAILLLTVHSAVALFIGFINALINNDPKLGFVAALGVAALYVFKFLVTYIAPALPVYGGIVAWAYLSASARLGIVDLFGCEISTLCRVGTIFDIGKLYVDQYDAPYPKGHTIDEPLAASTNFVYQEDYFPIFDHNSKDLQLLEAEVVCYITAFYTFMKAMRDSQRKLGQTKSPQLTLMGKPDDWHAALSNVIYMLFLGYESGRKAVEELVEFEPTAAENVMVILLTELSCYCFLLKYFEQGDLRYVRLKLRETDYKQIVPDLYRKVLLPHEPNENDWIRAKHTAPELRKRYEDTFGETLTPP